MSDSAVTLIKSELFRQGGLEKYSWQIAEDFCALETPVTVLTTGNPTPPFQHPLLKIVSLPVEHRLSVLNVLHFDKACHDYLSAHPTPIIFSLDRNRYQTHIRAGNGVHAAYLNRRSREEGWRKKCSFVFNPLHRAILSLEKTAFEHAQLKTLFTNSEMVKKEVLAFYQVDPNKIQVVHNGVEWQALHPVFETWESHKIDSAQKLSLNPDHFQFLFVGHNFRRKGLEKLLHALSWIKEEPFQLSVVGKEKNLVAFKTCAQKLGLGEKVFFFGPQKNVFSFYQIADCLVVPSLYDPFANVTIEGLAMGVFTLSSKNNGGHEVLTSQNGLIIPDLDDPSSFAAALKQALKRRKSPATAAAIRQSVKHLDFSLQLRKITESSLSK